MRPKTKPIKDLYFRFVQGTAFDKILNSQQVADALLSEGLLELVAHTSKPTFEHYRDRPKMKQFNFDDPSSHDKIIFIFERYIADRGL